MNELAILTAEHFEAEEKQLAKNNCPTLAEHIAAHNFYRERLVGVLLDGMAGLLDRKELLKITNDWFLKHMAEMDLASKDYMK